MKIRPCYRRDFNSKFLFTLLFLGKCITDVTWVVKLITNDLDREFSGGNLIPGCM